MIGLWTSPHPVAAALRTGLLPAALAWETARRGREAVYRTGLRPRRAPPLPAIGVGSLQVGGAGKTPVASWAARWLADRGARPAILLRGYGGDEGPLHRRLEHRALVVEDADRLRAAAWVAGQGADILVLDDHAQHLPIVADRSLLLIGVEALLGTRHVLPAGPWRQPWTTGSADVVVLTAKSAPPEACARARRLVGDAYPGHPVAEARLVIPAWERLDSGTITDADLRGRPVLALCGIADPRGFLSHVDTVARVRRRCVFRDHARYGARRLRRIVRAAESARVDYVVTTAKDAVKLRSAWPATAPPVLVAQLAVHWTDGEDDVTGVLDEALALRRLGSRTRAICAAAPTAAGFA
jgi:tetraacyldisaccharide 4'-kinase